MAVGLITDPNEANKILIEGKADLIALGRAFLHNPRYSSFSFIQNNMNVLYLFLPLSFFSLFSYRFSLFRLLSLFSLFAFTLFFSFSPSFLGFNCLLIITLF